MKKKKKSPGEICRELMKAVDPKKATVKALAELVGANASTVYRILKGKVNSGDVAEKLILVLQIMTGVKTKKEKKKMLSIEAKQFFNLNESPFQTGYIPEEEIFKTPSFNSCFSRNIQAVEESACLLTYGQVGTGKSVLYAAIQNHFENDKKTQLVMIPSISAETISSRLISGRIVRDIDKKTAANDNEVRAHQVVTSIQSASQRKKKIVIMIDEAQVLSPVTLKNLKRFHEGFTAGGTKIGILLFGMLESVDLIESVPEADNRFYRQELNPFEINGEKSNDKIIKEYIEFKLSLVGCESVLFSDCAFKSIAQAQRTPLNVNMFCTNALETAYQLDEKIVTSEVLEEC